MLCNTLAPGTRAIISKEKFFDVQKSKESKHHNHRDETTKTSNTHEITELHEG